MGGLVTSIQFIPTQALRAKRKLADATEVHGSSLVFGSQLENPTIQLH